MSNPAPIRNRAHAPLPQHSLLSYLRIGFIQSCLLALLVLGTGCQDAREKAVRALKKRQLQPVPETLVLAVTQRDTALLDLLQAAQVKAALPAAGQDSVLHLAARQQDWATVPSLLKFTTAAILNHAGSGQKTVLELVVEAGQSTLAQSLLAAGALPEAAGPGADALVRAASGDPELTDKLLLALPAGHTALGPALFRAVEAGQNDRVQLLLQHQASLKEKCRDGLHTVLEIAVTRGSPNLVEMLLQAGATPAESPRALLSAVEQKHPELVRLLLQAGATPAATVTGSPAPVEIAVQQGSLPIVELLLQHGADRSYCLETALSQPNQELLRLLLRMDHSPDALTDDGNPPLIRAAIAGHEDLISCLLEHKANPEQTGIMGQSAFHMAIIHRQNAAAALLLDAGATADSPFAKPAPPELLPLFDSGYFVKWYQRDDNLTPLMLAAARGDVPQMRLLLSKGAKRGAQTRAWHRYPIIFACDTNHIPAAQLLLGRDPDLETDRRYAVVSLSRQRVTLYRNDQLVRSAPVSTGKASTPTPPGTYVITDKQTDWVSSIYKVPMPFFMRLSCKEIGLHAGAIPGYPASHGCIRMPKTDVMAFFKMLKIGDPVTIEP